MTLLFAVCSFLVLGCEDGKKSSATVDIDTSAGTANPAASLVPPPVQGDDRELFMDAARTAWSFVENNYQPATGLTKAHETWPHITLWDVAGVIAAHYAARDLGLINDTLFDTRVSRTLKTLAEMPLVENTAFNSTYNSVTGKMSTRLGKETEVGDGWSVTDLGRLLVWLKILATNEPRYAERAAEIVRRLDMKRLVPAGIPQSLVLDEKTGAKKVFAETEIGYHQYASSGFAMWGADVRPTLNPLLNVRPVKVFGVPLTVDTRDNDRVMSEGYLMMGLETGWYRNEYRDRATQVLAAQRARHKATKIVTMVTEDAMPDPPHYFYYYSVYHRGKPFLVEGPGSNQVVTKPRWVSTKAAYGWHALMPSAYTRLVVKTVQPAATPGRGWASGVYEGTKTPASVRSLNTAALILESAMYAVKGRPVMSWVAP